MCKLYITRNTNIEQAFEIVRECQDIWEVIWFHNIQSERAIEIQTLKIAFLVNKSLIMMLRNFLMAFSNQQSQQSLAGNKLFFWNALGGVWRFIEDWKTMVANRMQALAAVPNGIPK